MQENITQKLGPLQDTHKAFTASMHNYFEIDQIPDDLRNPEIATAEDCVLCNI
jgi:hypothetical protein